MSASDAAWREELKAGVAQFSRSKTVDEAVWTEFAANVSYCQGDLTDPAAYTRLGEKLASFGVGDSGSSRTSSRPPLSQ